MPRDDVRREDGLDPWGYPEVPVEEYAPAQLGEGSPRPQEPVCVSCWTVLTQDPCQVCGRPQKMSDIDWYRIVFGLCKRCGNEMVEGGCDNCGQMGVAA